MMAGVHFLYVCTFAIVTCFCYATADEGVGIPVKLGGKVTLKCVIRNIPSNISDERVIAWVKKTPRGDELISFGGISLMETTFAIDVIKEKNTHNINLIVLDAKESDEGMYQCEVIIPRESVALASYNLEVDEEPKEEENGNTVKDIAIEIGSRVTFKCDTRNIPSRTDETVVWVKKTPRGDQLISVGEFTFTADIRFSVYAKDNHAIDLIIKDAKESDEGMYQCLVNIQKENVVSSSYNLEVEEDEKGE